MGKKEERKFDIQVWYCGNPSCGRYFYVDTADDQDEDDEDFACPYGCCGGLEYKGRFKVSGEQIPDEKES